MAILDIRGTHGSGKSWVVHRLLAEYEHRDFVEPAHGVTGYHLPAVDCGVVGRYERTCGGCDGIKTQDEVCRRVREYARMFRHVILEGILVAHTFSRYHALATEMEAAGHPYYFVFLNTPLRVCVARVVGRRLKAGNEKPLNKDNLVRDWHRIWERLRLEVAQAGHRVAVADYRDPMSTIRSLLKS